MKKRHFPSWILTCTVCLGLFAMHSTGGTNKQTAQENNTEWKKPGASVVFPDLVAFIQRPPTTAYAGKKLQEIRVVVKNIGIGTKKAGPCFFTYLVLSKDTLIPVASVILYGPFKEDRGLGAGMGNCGTFAPGDCQYIHDFGTQSMPMVIPADTPPGDYYLGVVVDPDKWITESNEGNNTHYVPIKIL